MTSPIIINTTIEAPVEKVWELWTTPKHIKEWNSASADWHTPVATNDLRPGGAFLSRMEAKDGSFGFDFSGIYDEVKEHEFISYSLADGRKVTIAFTGDDKTTTITETFDPENENSRDMQRDGWQAILNNFKAHAEEN